MTTIVLPNVRKVIIPDPGYTLFEADLAGADARVVAWEAEDDDLKDAFRRGLDVHVKNATDIDPGFINLKGHARDKARQDNKKAVHLTNYGGSARTLATALGWSDHKAVSFQAAWFSLHPGIRDNFQSRIEKQIQETKTVYNKFGFRRVYYDRPHDCYTEALAWVPQSTVALNTYLGAFNLEAKFPWVEFLLQVHDSLVFQFPQTNCPPSEEIKKALEVTIPYADPLIIPWDLKLSTKSWGECEKPY